MRNANTWYKIDMPKDEIVWQLRARGNHDLYYSFEPSHSTYITLSAGNVVSEDTAPNREIRAIYVMGDTDGMVAELEIWRR